jgi:hypothetical protein
MRLRDLALCLLVTAVPVAGWSHGDWPPKNGGIMNKGGETSFELVQRSDGIHIYVEDHGEIVLTTGSNASLTVANGKQTKTYQGQSSAKNKLVFPKVSIRPGDRVTLKVQFAAGNIAVGRYVMPEPRKK